MNLRRFDRQVVAALLIGCVAITSGCSSSGAQNGSGEISASSELSSSSSTTEATTTTSMLPAGAFDAADTALRQRIAAAGLSGGVLRVVRNGEVIHDLSVGAVSGSTPLSVASSTKWLTAATLMTFVDDGSVALDDEIARWLPEFAANAPLITVRQLLVHTSGVRDRDCLWSGGSLADCVNQIANGPKQFPAGSAYSYGNADFHVIGRLIEELGGKDFSASVRDRVTGPLAMDATTWPGAPNAPGPAAGVRTSVDDYMKFLAMIAGRGEVHGRRVLSTAAIDSLISDQLGGYDTAGDFAVGITRIPRYGLGCWPDVVGPGGETIVVSGNGGKGFYPWVDFATNSYGLVGVQDDRGAQLAVPASQKVAVLARSAIN